MSARQKSAGAVWAAVLTALAVWWVVGIAANAASTSRYHAALRHADNQQHFYEVIAGQAEPGTSVADALALDLRKVPEAKLRFFRGNSNSYGSITRVLGFDPFDESCGVECGPLTQQALTFIKLAKHDTVYRPQVTRHKVDTSLAVLAIVVWVLAGLVYLLWPQILRYRTQQKLEHAYPDECRTLEQLTQTLNSGRLSARDRQEVRELRDGLATAISNAVALRSSNPDDADSVAKSLPDQQVDRLLTEGRNKLTAIEAGNRILEGGMPE